MNCPTTTHNLKMIFCLKIQYVFLCILVFKRRNISFLMILLKIQMQVCRLICDQRNPNQHPTMCHPFFLAYEQMQGQQCFLSDNKSLAHLMSAMISAPPVSKALAQATTVLSTSMAHSISIVLLHSSLTPMQSKGSFWSAGSAGAAWLPWNWQTAKAASRSETAIIESFCIVGIIIYLQVLMRFMASQLFNNYVNLQQDIIGQISQLYLIIY